MTTRSMPRITQGEVDALTEDTALLADNIEHVIRGKRDVVELTITSLLAEGHILIDDVPGIGKTSLARALAGSIGGSYGRIQFTPDLLPTDVTGVSVFNQKMQEFEFRRGAVFANIVLADEINRASPKTQSALLEVMEEARVTVDGISHDVPRPFIVTATQNPIEMDGTYPLPEAQLDRFLMRIRIGYPDPLAEREVLQNHTSGHRQDELKPVISTERILEMIEACSRVYVAEALHDYIIEIASSTRSISDVRLGVSPRGSVALLRAARAFAASQGRIYVIPEDVKTLGSSVLSHRLVLDPEALLRGTKQEDIIERVLAAVRSPQPVTV